MTASYIEEEKMICLPKQSAEAEASPPLGQFNSLAYDSYLLFMQR